MSKRIVLCSDGTGNSGGKGNGTNVWRIYQAIDRNIPDCPQIAFYDDGVGTENNKYIRMFGGATGWGFTRNVKDLYKYLVRNYDEGDRIYLFGFSRGAYTVRALAAFILYCGIIKDGWEKSESDLDKTLKRLIKKYKNRRPGDTLKDSDPRNYDYPCIECVGVWDTVSAIGVPFDIGLKELIEERFFTFNFQDQALSTRVKHGFHALAIDDERRTFHPITWNAGDNLEQVWFAGVHSNVGGGYPKQGMAYVSLDWMMGKVEHEEGEREWGLHFDPDLRHEARLFANVHDKMYDSRAGLAAYYRYEPRDIESPCRNGNESCGDAIAIHESVFDRMDSRTLAYSPGNLPSTRPIKVVRTDSNETDTKREDCVRETANDRQNLLKDASKWIRRGKGLHMAFVLLTMLIASSLLKLGLNALRPPDAPSYGWTISLIFAAAFAAIMFYIRTFYSRLLCSTALAILAVAEYAPLLFGYPIAVADWIKSILAFLLPDLLADNLVIFIEKYPTAALAALIAVIVMVCLKIWIDANLAKVFETACDQIRRKPIPRPNSPVRVRPLPQSLDRSDEATSGAD